MVFSQINFLITFYVSVVLQNMNKDVLNVKGVLRRPLMDTMVQSLMLALQTESSE